MMRRRGIKGADTLYGSRGADTLNGNKGSDVICLSFFIVSDFINCWD